MDDLELRAGPAALARIREHGLRREDIKAIAGAAGGPKWLILGHLDRFIFGDWLAEAEQQIDLVGASIGAWRFAAACRMSDPVRAITALEKAYVEQSYSDKPDRDEVTRVTQAIQDQYFDDAVLQGVLKHPKWRLTVITARSRAITASEQRFVLGAGSGVAALANGISRAWIGSFFERVLFHSPTSQPANFAADGIATRHIPLTAGNARDAVYASGSIPMIMSGVRNPQDAPAGVYRDGGIVDYHIDQPLSADGIVLMPHFSDRVIPGWFDKFLPWRRPRHTDNLLLLSPSPAFLASIPNGHVPDRKDFYLYAGDNAARIRDWRLSVAAGERLADAFKTWVESNNPAAALKPLNA